MRYHPGHNCFWITPGGGLEPGETIDEALRRELKEELGLQECQIGPLVLSRRYVFNPWRQLYQNEDFYVVHVARFEPSMTDAPEREWFDQLRWWSVTELANTKEDYRPARWRKSWPVTFRTVRPRMDPKWRFSLTNGGSFAAMVNVVSHQT